VPDGGRGRQRAGGAAVLEGKGLVKQFSVRVAGRRARATLHAVSSVDIELARGETLGLVGETGCGKSTTARLLLRLEDPDEGSVELGGVDLTRLDASQLRAKRAEAQVVFQDPFAALNPRLTVREILAEPLVIHRRPDWHRRVDELLE